MRAPQAAAPPRSGRLTAKVRKAGRPLAADGEATRLRIMNAAQVCFGANGYRETSNRMIADMAGVTSGTIYHYFANKRDLFLSVYEAIQTEIQARIDGVLSRHESVAESLEAMLQLMMAMYVEHPNWAKFNAVVRTEALRNPEISDARADQAWRHLYRRLADRGVETGEIEAVNARAVRAVLAAVILGTVQHGMEANLTDHRECMRGLGLLFKGELMTKPAARRRKA
jgi:AcrR family transcriptional regulator